LSELFAAEVMNDLDISAIGDAFNDSAVRGVWLNLCFDELRCIHMEVDRRLLSEELMGIEDLCARRRAFQDVLEMVLSARRQVVQGMPHNPPPSSPPLVDLDRVTG